MLGSIGDCFDNAVIVLIDVDGVLIPFPDSEGNGPATHVRHSVVPTGYDAGSPVPIWLNPTHGPMLAELISELPLTPVWCTSWRGDASPLIGAKLGLEPFPHVELARQDITTSHPTATSGNETTSQPGSTPLRPSGSTTTSPPPTTPGRSADCSGHPHLARPNSAGKLREFNATLKDQKRMRHWLMRRNVDVATIAGRKV
ncbi:hypothetical protein [Microbispora sp. KK1-11]|uniref:hypothetical protein n=1 Tax=Microbispora sp. KK1-11 TaxID=2053005 RepID=UPI001C8DF724|nr:hypothetical protein [Microbispora sp. KK1-11]